MPPDKQCVNLKDVPCPKAQAYLKKHGLICGSEEKPADPKPKKKKKSLLDEWFS